MSKMQVKTSPQEKEKLRKRLQKLFQNHENSEESAAGKSSKKKRQRKNKQTNNQQIEGQMEQQVTANKLKHNKTTPKNVKKQQQSQKKRPATTDETSKQNGFVKATNPANGKQNLNNLTKIQGSVQKKVKTKEAKFQQKKAALDKKTCENPQTKASPSMQQTKPPNNAKTISPKTINKIKKEVTDIFQKKNNKKSSAEIKNKSQPKSQKASEKNQQNENVPKSGQTSTFKQNNSATNAQTKVNNNQNKKAKKRAASENKSVQETPTTSKKKPKLSKKSNKTKEKATKSNKKIKTKANLSNSSSSQLEENEFDVSDGITGCVRGGDFDTDSEEDDMEQNYWMHEENYGSDDDEDNASDSEVQKFKKKSETELEQYNHKEASGSEEEYFDSEDEDDEFDEYFDDDSDEEEEEEDETYSDFDENDYEEDEDSYNYSMDSDDDDNSSNYNNMSYDFNEDENDDDYKLPKNIPEDLIIHKGTATKRDLKPDDNVSFDSDNEQTQIVELEVQNNVKVVHQPKGYEREELLKLKYEEKTLSSITFHKKMPMPATGSSSDTEDCPKLVPIIDEDGFQLYNPNEESDDEVQEEMEGEEEEEEYEGDEEQSDENESMEEYENDDMDDVSLGSEYMELNSDDADSLLSEDINEKYLNRGHDDSESDYSIDEDMWNKKHKVDVIDATGYKCEKKKLDSDKDHSDISLNDDINQIPSLKLYENVDLKTGSSILSTTIIDKKPFKSIDNIEKELSVKPKKIQETQNNTTQTETWPEEPAKVTEILQQDESMEKSVDNQDESLEESIDNQDETMEESIEKPVQTAKIVKSTAQSLVDYNTKFFNAFDSNLVVVLLKDPFYIYGTIRLTLLAGKVEVYGHALKLNTEVEIFSPRGCSVIEISPSSVNKMSKQDLNKTLKPYEKHFALADLKTISDLYNSETDAVVLLKRNEARKKVVQQFKKFMNENVFPNINNINVDRPLYNTEYLLRCMINTSAQEQKCLRLPQQWQQINITPKSRVMLTGGKSVGKSTLLRYLINRHLPQQILLIDLDIGQPEVFVPQTVSCTIVKQPLLGPGFMLNLQPEISYAVGHTNIALCAHKYIAAVRSLIAHCKAQEEYKDMPWLINTMGYNKGFGLELISVIAQELPLTDVIQLQSRKEIKNFDCILHAHVLSNVPRIMFSQESSADEIMNAKLNYRLHVWQSAVEQESRYQKEWEMSAKDLRFAMLLARLSEALQGHAEWLTDIKPLSASLNDLKIVNLMGNAAEASTEELAKSVEANLVYLCHHQEDNNNPLKCLGIGVVRAVDLHVQQLYLIPAIPYTQLKDINCVAIGEMPLPSSLFTNQGSTVKNTAPFVYNTIAANASKAIKQIYHRPRKFLTGKHKSLN